MATYSKTPIDGYGELIVCPACYPMFVLVPPVGASDGLHAGHYRRGFRNSQGIDVYEDGKKLLHVEEATALPDVPGLLLREFVTTDDGSLVLCGRHGHASIMTRYRYAPKAEIRRDGA